MKIDTLKPALNLQSFYDFVKLSKTQQGEMLTEKGIFLDLDTEKDTYTRLYFLNGFFVEEITCKELNEVIDIIPYKQGYRIEKYLQIKKAPLNKKPILLQWCIN